MTIIINKQKLFDKISDEDLLHREFIMRSKLDYLSIRRLYSRDTEFAEIPKTVFTRILRILKTTKKTLSKD